MIKMDCQMDLFSLLDDDYFFKESDPNFQEAANATTQSHFENDLASFSTLTSGNFDKVDSFSYDDDMEINDTPCTSLSKDEVDVKTGVFSRASELSQLQTVKKAEPEHHLSLLQNTTYLQSSNYGESQPFGAPLPDHNSTTMSNEDIDDLLISPNSKPSPGGNIKFKKSPTYDSPVPSTSGCKPRQEAPTKNALTARANRLKKKNFVENLQKSIVSLKEENRDLTQRLESVTAENEKKDSQIEYLRNVLLDEKKIFNFLKEVPFLTSVGFPTEGRCVTVRSIVPPDKTETRGTSRNYNNNTSISKTTTITSSSLLTPAPFSSIEVGSPSSETNNDNQLILRNDPPNGSQIIENDSSKNIEHQMESNYPRNGISGKVKKGDHQRCFSSWGSKGKGKKK